MVRNVRHAMEASSADDNVRVIVLSPVRAVRSAPVPRWMR